MAKLIVKPTINFLTTTSDADLIVAVGAILAALEDNPDYPDPQPSLATIAEGVEAFQTAIDATFQGGVLDTLRKNTKRAELVALARQLASYVTVACQRDLLKLLGSGFPVHKPTRSAIGRLESPTTPRLKHGGQSGLMDARTKSIYGVFIYNWQIFLETDPQTIVQTVQSTGSRTTFSRLTPGQVYRVRVNAVGAAGPSEFSDFGQLMAI